jgi:hypothetical protein
MTSSSTSTTTTTTTPHHPNNSNNNNPTNQQLSLKVLRLALSRAPQNLSAIDTVPAAPWRSLLTLPMVFEQVHAGQRLRCLARAMNAPGDCTLVAILEPPNRAAMRIVGESKGQGTVDVLISAILTEPGPHELVVTLKDKTNQELLRKIYRIDVAQALAGSFSITNVRGGTVLVSCKLSNVSRGLPICVTRLEYQSSSITALSSSTTTTTASVVESTPPTTNNILPSKNKPDIITTCTRLFPGDSHVFVFPHHRNLGNHVQEFDHIGTLNVDWTSGLGEIGQWSFPVFRRLPRVDYTIKLANEEQQIPTTGEGLQLVLESTSKETTTTATATTTNNNLPRLSATHSAPDLLLHGPLLPPIQQQQQPSKSNPPTINSSNNILNNDDNDNHLKYIFTVVPTRLGVFRNVTELLGIVEPCSEMPLFVSEQNNTNNNQKS